MQTTKENHIYSTISLLTLQSYQKMKNIRSPSNIESQHLLAILISCTITATIFIITILNKTSIPNSIACSLSTIYSGTSQASTDYATTPIQLLAIFHYATSSEIPQLSIPEIHITYRVLHQLAPCNFLVFGMGHDTLMWTSLNPRGTTLYLEEDFQTVLNVVREAPIIRAHAVRYLTRLADADYLLKSYKSEPECMPPHMKLGNDSKCSLALTELPEEVYRTEWDIIMIDGPKGFDPETTPGRMGVIFTAAVMARARMNHGVTHVFVHDVDRKVERMYADEFLCNKYRVRSIGRLWHFVIPPAFDGNSEDSSFCS